MASLTCQRTAYVSRLFCTQVCAGVSPVMEMICLCPQGDSRLLYIQPHLENYHSSLPLGLHLGVNPKTRKRELGENPSIQKSCDKSAPWL